MAHESYAPSKAGTKKQTKEGGGRGGEKRGVGEAEREKEMKDHEKYC